MVGTLKFSLNHMTSASTDFDGLIALAQQTGCVAVECRNDLSAPLFDGASAEVVAKKLSEASLTLVAVAEIKRFDQLVAGSPDFTQALGLMDAAQDAGAVGVGLIPCNDGQGLDLDALKIALGALHPELEKRGLIGLIEPLGFSSCGLSSKRLVVSVLQELGFCDRFQLIHDTFHHHLAGEDDIFAAHTGLVHISGVAHPHVASQDMVDDMRGLVDAQDRLGNVEQIRSLQMSGYAGFYSFEAFAPHVHADPRLSDRISQSKSHISAMLQEVVA